MRLELKEFQEAAVGELVRKLRSATRDADAGDRWAVLLSAPTGSGKTLMATAAIERLIEGDEDEGPDPSATFLWITDLPELNEQTRAKMQSQSSVLNVLTLTVIDNEFKEPVLSPGRVYFLNTQKLGRNSLLVRRGDNRSRTIWEILSRTIEERRGHFYVIIDEAHRGMSEDAGARATATTIIQRFLKDCEELPPVPMVVGISATPTRFSALLQGSGRDHRTVEVSPEDVRASGLLKETIVIDHPPASGGRTDMTMLREACRTLLRFERRWKKYGAAADGPGVRPILVVQVEDAPGGKSSAHSKTKLETVLDALDEELRPLNARAVAHAFEQGASIKVGNRRIRHLAASKIDIDRQVRVVLFKTALNTGWDCPRAEVMMSFRRAVDTTSIAQLVGRMVRTPLARRIEADEYLNSVSLFLPHYDDAAVNAVVDRLSTGDPDFVPPTKAVKAAEWCVLDRAAGTEALFDALEDVSTYVVPRQRRQSDVRRLMKLARQLGRDRLEKAPVDEARKLVLDHLEGALATKLADPQFLKEVKEGGLVAVRQVAVRYGEGRSGTLERSVGASMENIDDLFNDAGRRLADGLHRAFWRHLVGDSKDRSRIAEAKLQAAALLRDDSLIKSLETLSQQRVQAWLRRHAKSIRALPESSREVYDQVRRMAGAPESKPLELPPGIEWRPAGRKWKGHLYVEQDGLVRARLNKLETEVIEGEMKRPDFLAWFRNVDRKPWALTVPYDMHGVKKPMFPDFLVFRSGPAGVVVDILDPHAEGLEDAAPKARGLASFSQTHAPEFGRIELITKLRGRLLRLDLCDETTREAVARVASSDHLRQLYQEMGR